MTDARVTQAPVEVIRDAQGASVDARVTQVPVEVIRNTQSADVFARATQVAVEVIRSVDTVTREIIASDTLDISFTEVGTRPGAAKRRPVFFILHG